MAPVGVVQERGQFSRIMGLSGAGEAVRDANGMVKMISLWGSKR